MTLGIFVLVVGAVLVTSAFLDVGVVDLLTGKAPDKLPGGSLLKFPEASAAGIDSGGPPGAGGPTGATGAIAGTPKDVIDNVVLPMAKSMGMCACGCSPAAITAKNATHGPTTSGGRSDHQGPPSEAWAADLCGSSASMNRFAGAVAKKLGVPWSGSNPLATASSGGYRFQVIHGCYCYGNHYNHVHVGVRKA